MPACGVLHIRYPWGVKDYGAGLLRAVETELLRAMGTETRSWGPVPWFTLLKPWCLCTWLAWLSSILVKKNRGT